MTLRAIAGSPLRVVAEVRKLETRITLFLLLPKLTRIDMAIRFGKARISAAHTGIGHVTVDLPCIEKFDVGFTVIPRIGRDALARERLVQSVEIRLRPSTTGAKVDCS